ncbi:MAG: glycyl-radical enzyme activating protein [Ruminococcaceae bacterium]|nr:glycyl-radical enzyme activating protein [Oscillospiraceae bacterium]
MATKGYTQPNCLLKENVLGKVFNIQKFCTSDGPGIRTTVFLKGCPLRCVWCHNPESHSFSDELSYNSDNCISCGRCVMSCPNQCHKIINGGHVFDRNACRSCFRCIQPACKALKRYGYEISADEIIQDAMKDEAFYRNSGGGITLSGGEPFAQPEFCVEILKKAKENGLHTCIETCGHISTDILAQSLDFVDLYLFDYKETDPVKHTEYTGVDNTLILENLRYINSVGKQIILRCPLIPTFNDTKEHFEGIADIANKYANIIKVEIEPYHDFGCNKYEQLGKAINEQIKSIGVSEKTNIEGVLAYIQDKTSKPVIIA